MDELSLRIDEEIRGGLKCGKEERDAALVALDYYELRGAKYIQRRDGESFSDYVARTKRSLPFTRRVVDLLCSHLYNPGPARRFEDDALGEWWELVAEDNLVNALWQRADKYATLHGTSMFQAARTGDPMHPVKVHLWTRDQFETFTPPDDSTTVTHVVTIERIDETTVYKWWSADKIRTYRSKKLGLHQTSGGQVAEYMNEEDNVYGILPFSFVHYDLPVRSFTTHGLGCYLSEINQGIDSEASDMAEAVKAYHKPKGVLYNGSADQQIIDKVGAFIRVNANPSDFETVPPPRLEYLQAQLDITGGWDNIRSAILTVLEGLGIPETAYRLNQATLPSGAAQVAEQAPLADYSRARQEPYKLYEKQFIEMCTRVDGIFLDDIGLSLTWPAQSITLPGADRDQQDQDALNMGLESLVMICQRRYGMTEDEAEEHLAKVAEQNRKYPPMWAQQQSASTDPNAAATQDPLNIPSEDTSNTGEVNAQDAPDDTSY